VAKRGPRRRTGAGPATSALPPDLHECLVVGYHGCEREVARRILLGEEELTQSSNDYDWLGEGIYFWEHGLTRARQFAQEKRERGELKDPVVSSAPTSTSRAASTLRTCGRRDSWHPATSGFATSSPHAVSRPRERTAHGPSRRSARRLDCAVINLCLDLADEGARSAGRPFGFDTVRAVFEEGMPAFAGCDPREIARPDLRQESSLYPWRVPPHGLQYLRGGHSARHRPLP